MEDSQCKGWAEMAHRSVMEEENQQVGLAGLESAGKRGSV